MTIAQNNDSLQLAKEKAYIEKCTGNLNRAARNAELIVKGTIIKKYGFSPYMKGSKIGGEYKTAIIIKIEKVLKGIYSQEFIQTYNEGGRIGNVSSFPSHTINDIKCNIGTMAYFCLENSEIQQAYSPDTTTNLPIYKPLGTICMELEINKETNKRDLLVGRYEGLYLNSEEQIYKELGLKYDLPKESKKKEKSVLEKQNENKLKSQIFHNKQQEFYLKKEKFNLTKSAVFSDPESCKEPFFSEFFNGTNLNKALEIFNPRATSINLHGFYIKAGLIGQSALISVTLDGTIQPKGTYVISNLSADSSILSVANKIVNDSMLLNTVQITLEDSTGKIYDKIGSTQLADWITYSLQFYSSHSFKRDYSISVGDSSWVTAQSTWNAISQNDYSNIQRHINICSPMSNNINFKFDNFIMSNSNGSDYVEFDIMASSNVNTYIQNAPFYIQYDNAAFGTYIVMDGNITVTRGNLFGNSYENPQSSMFDSLMNMFVVGITDDFNAGSWNRPLVSSIPIQVLHFKIKILNCDQTVDFNFVEQQTTSFVTLGVPTATEDLITGSFYFYDNVSYTNLQGAVIPECQIYITQINNSTTNIHVIAGDINDPNSVLTIQGGHFGAVQGTGKLYMKNADDAGVTWLELDSYDMTWSDNLITVKIPSVGMNSNILPVGSGPIKIVNSNSDMAISNQNVIVDYSLKNYLTNTPIPFKNRDIIGIEASTDNKLYFRLTPDVNNNPNLKKCIAKAIKDWRCSTTVNWFLDTITTNVDSIGYNLVSSVFLKYDLPANILAVARPHLIDCSNTNNNSIGYVSDIDIAINANRLNDMEYDTTFLQPIGQLKYDFYEVILHELGHANLLNHTNQSNAIMYPYANYGPLTIAQRKTFIDYDNMDGGINVVTKSNNTTNFLCTGVQTMATPSGGNCTGTSGERVITNNNSNSLSIFPNPVNDILNINYTLLRNGNASILIINSLGQVVKEITNNQTIGTYSLTVDTKPFSSGIYYIRFSNGENFKQAKVIVQ
ncbi:MAG: T9SS type A sorting domain-containing protein [Bacteroidia bacterium]|nr:T9SS type A sorting domain-containing protein [Bacteroidia bacterium]